MNDRSEPSPASQRAADALFPLSDGSVQVLLLPHLQEQGVTDPVIGSIIAGYRVAARCTFASFTGAAYRAHRNRWLITGGCSAR